jgi:hypothetical protein
MTCYYYIEPVSQTPRQDNQDLKNRSTLYNGTDLVSFSHIRLLCANFAKETLGKADSKIQ